MNNYLIIVLITLLVLLLTGVVLFGMNYNKEHYGNSPAFDPSVRGGVAGIGPVKEENTEGFCGSCA